MLNINITCTSKILSICPIIDSEKERVKVMRIQKELSTRGHCLDVPPNSSRNQQKKCKVSCWEN